MSEAQQQQAVPEPGREPEAAPRSTLAAQPDATAFQVELALWLHAIPEPWDDRAAADAVRAVAESLPDVGARLRLDDPDFLDDLQRDGVLLVAHGLRRRVWDFVSGELGREHAVAALRHRGGGLARWLGDLREKRPEIVEVPPALGHVLAEYTRELNPKEVEEQVALVAKARPELIARLLAHLANLTPERAFELFLASDAGDGDDLLALLEAWERGGYSLEQARRLLWSRVDPKLGIELAASFYYALEKSSLGVDADEFFRSIGRWPRPARDELELVLIPPLEREATEPVSVEEREGELSEPFEVLRARVAWSSFELLTHGPITTSTGFQPRGATWWEAWLYSRWCGGFLPSEEQWHFAAAGARSAAERWGLEDLEAGHEWLGEPLPERLPDDRFEPGQQRPVYDAARDASELRLPNERDSELGFRIAFRPSPDA